MYKINEYIEIGKKFDLEETELREFVEKKEEGMRVREERLLERDLKR